MRTAVAAMLGSLIVVAAGDTRSNDDPSLSFITSPVERGRITTQVKATGTVEALVAVDVSSQLSGRIAGVFVDFNDRVKAGQPIAQIDQEIFVARVSEATAALRVARAGAHVQAAALERAKGAVANAQTARELAEAQSAGIQARHDEAERDFQRKLALARAGAGAERDLTQARALRDSAAADLRAAISQIQMKAEAIAIAEAEERMARANLENAQAVAAQKEAGLHQAQVDLDRTVLRAPIDGMIIQRDVNPGQTVAVSLEAKTLFKIANDLREMEVHGKIDEADIGQLKVGQPVRFTVDAYPERTFGGTVRQIRKSPEVVQNVVTYTAVVSAPNPDRLLLPGMTAQLRIVISDTGEVLKIPNQALRYRPNGVDPTAARGVAKPGALPKDSSTVWVIGANKQPVPVPVKLGAADDTDTALLQGGLTDGQPLIVGAASPPNSGGVFGLRLGF